MFHRDVEVLKSRTSTKLYGLEFQRDCKHEDSTLGFEVKLRGCLCWLTIVSEMFGTITAHLKPLANRCTQHLQHFQISASLRLGFAPYHCLVVFNLASPRVE